MVLLISPIKAQQQMAENLRKKRLQLNLTQDGLAKRSGVALASLRKFEHTGAISLESFLKLQMVLGGIEDIIQATSITEENFSSIDEVLKSEKKAIRQRGRRK